MSRIIIFGKLIFQNCNAIFCITVPTFSAAPQLFFLRPSIVSFRKNLSVRTGDSLSALAVMKGSDAYDFLIGFRREREVNPMNKKGEL